MAGSLKHIVGDDGKFTMQHIDNLGDAYEALEECFFIIRAMSGGCKEEVNKYCDALGFVCIEQDLT